MEDAELKVLNNLYPLSLCLYICIWFLYTFVFLYLA